MKENYAAGVIFYFKSKYKVYFLLGKDFRLKWSDFGGKVELQDKMNPIKTAIRECYEETLGVVLNKYDLLYKIKKDPKFVVGESYLKKKYFMYLVKLENLYDYNENFSLLRHNLKNLESQFKEKLQLRWFTMNEILENKNDKFRNVFYETIKKNYSKILSIINA